MSQYTNEQITELLNKNTKTFLGVVNECNLVTAQSMHDVYKVNSENGRFYVKLGKPAEKDKGAKEMQTEVQWYKNFMNLFKLPEIPDAEYFVLDSAPACVVQEVAGKEYDKLLLSAKSDSEKNNYLKDLFKISTLISTYGKLIKTKFPEETKTYFGEFDATEADFLKKRTLKILNAELPDNEDILHALENILSAVQPFLTDKQRRYLYRDAVPNNWILTQKGNIVPIDLGSTSYRPAQLELVALIETPKTGLDHYNEDTRQMLIYSHYRYLMDAEEKSCARGVDLTPQQYCQVFDMASLVKNCSGIATRMQHIKNNRQELNTAQEDQRKIYESRLEENIAGKRFHITRALKAAERLEKEKHTLSENELIKVIGFLENLLRS